MEHTADPSTMFEMVRGLTTDLVQKRGYSPEVRWSHGVVEKALMDGDARVHSGLVSTNEEDRAGDTIEPEAHRKAMERRRGVVPLLKNHNPDAIVGNCVEFDFTETGLYTRGEIFRGTRMADEAWIELQGKALGFYSFGFLPLKKEGKENGGMRVWDYDMVEVTLTPMPMNPGALGDVNQHAIDTEAIYYKALTDMVNERLETDVEGMLFNVRKRIEDDQDVLRRQLEDTTRLLKASAALRKGPDGG